MPVYDRSDEAADIIARVLRHIEKHTGMDLSRHLDPYFEGIATNQSEVYFNIDTGEPINSSPIKDALIKLCETSDVLLGIHQNGATRLAIQFSLDGEM